MMTERHYFKSDELSLHTEVQLCTPTQEGEYEIILAATVFHPQGGGQPSDVGCIAGVKVKRVFQTGEQIIHLTGHPVTVGSALIEVCPETRRLHTQLHSAGHLIGCYGELAGWRPVKAHHWPGEARVVFENGGATSALPADELAQQIQSWITADLPRHTSLQAGQRQIGFGHLPAHSCGGTHALSTGQIGHVNITRIKEKKGQLSVHYALGPA
ncbi:alanyl-tRNA editing protein [Undibacterium sp. Ji42W]|uniref:alanyl-tRNA editing protein n=1 Tax=Undibacterium sp. Ji42W TaxID=3413039 RepID=UPI003BF322A8